MALGRDSSRCRIRERTHRLTRACHTSDGILPRVAEHSIGTWIVRLLRSGARGKGLRDQSAHLLIPGRRVEAQIGNGMLLLKLSERDVCHTVDLPVVCRSCHMERIVSTSSSFVAYCPLVC